MPDKIFVSLPIIDIVKACNFYQALGWKMDPTFSDADSGCVIVSDAIYLMLLPHDRFRQISPKPMLLPRDGATSLIALSCTTRTEVDLLTEAAIGAGGIALHAAEDLGFMYSRAFEDPDGNGFGPFWINPTSMSA